MAEEKDAKETEQSQMAEGTASSESQVVSEQKAEPEDFKAKFEELKSEHSKLSQQFADTKEQLDTVTPYVDWDKAQGREKPAESAEDEYQEPMTKQEVDARIREAERQFEIRALTMQFRQEHPELRDYERSLVGPTLTRLIQENPHAPMAKQLEKAVQESKEFLEKERAKGEQKAQEETQRKAAEVAKASGLGSAGTTPPKTESNAGETNEEYIARRKEQSRRARGLPV